MSQTHSRIYVDAGIIVKRRITLNALDEILQTYHIDINDIESR